jgi:BlaI family penicillinase repressor
MPRYPSPQPTEVELEILHVLWELGPCPLGDIHQAVAERREVAYSTTRKMIQVMREKGLVTCDDSVRPQIYRAARTQRVTQQGLLNDLVHRAFAGSTEKLVMSLLSADKLTAEELAELKDLLEKGKG